MTKENFKALKNILNDDASFYSLQFTKTLMKEVKDEMDDVAKTNPILYTHIDDFTEVKKTVYSPPFVDNINSFCKIDGFAVLIEMIDQISEDATIEQLREFLDICISTGPYLNTGFKIQVFGVMVEKILDIFKSYPDEKLKTISQEEFEKFINCFEFILESIHADDKTKVDEIVQKFELELALRFLNTEYIEKRVNGLNILISKVNLVNRSNFQCTWKRKVVLNRNVLWINSENYLKWLIDNDIFGLFFGEKLHSELVVKYYAVLSFLYSKDHLNEKHLELIWD